MIRLCKLVFRTSHHIHHALAPKPQFQPLTSLSYLRVNYFSSAHNFKPNQSILSSHDPVNDEILHDAIEFAKTLPREDSSFFQRIFDKYASVKELELLSEDENKALVGLFNYMANICHDQNENSEALKYFTRVSEMVERGLVKKTIDFAFNDMGIASTYYQMGEFDKADEYIGKAIKYSPDIPDDEIFNMLVIDAKCLQCRVTFSRGYLDEALTQFQDIIPLFNTLPPESQPSFYRTAYVNIGDIYIAQNDYQSAINSYKQGLQRVAEINGEEGQETEELYLKLAQCLTRVKAYDQALIYAQKGYEVDTKLRGNQGWIALDSLLEVRNSQFDLKDFKRCLKSCKEMLKMLENNPQTNKHYINSTYFTMVAAYLLQGEPKKAKKQLKIAINELETSFPEPNDEMIEVYVEYADFLRMHATKEFIEDANNMYYKLIDVSTQLGNIRRELHARTRIAQTIYEQGEIDEALSHFQFNLQKLENQTEDCPQDLEITHAWLTEVYLKKNQLDLALKHEEAAIEACRQTNNESRCLAAYCLGLGDICEAQGDLEGSEKAYREMLDLMAEDPEKSDDDIKAASVHLLRVLDRQKKEEEIEEVRKKYEIDVLHSS